MYIYIFSTNLVAFVYLCILNEGDDTGKLYLKYLNALFNTQGSLTSPFKKKMGCIILLLKKFDSTKIAVVCYENSRNGSLGKNSNPVV